MKQYFLYKWEIYKSRNGEKSEAPIKSYGTVSEEEMLKITRGYKATQTDGDTTRYTRIFSKYFYETIEVKQPNRKKGK